MKVLVVSVLVAAVTASVCTSLLSEHAWKEGKTFSELHQQRVPAADKNHASTDQASQQLTDQINFLIKQQGRLENEIKELKTRMNQTVENDTQTSTFADTDISLLNDEPIFGEETPEENVFELLETEFSFEEDDPAWQAEMADSISRIVELLQQLNIESIQVGNYECRSNSCIVEYNFSDPEILYKIRPILKTGHSGQSAFKEINENGQRKLIAIYKH